MALPPPRAGDLAFLHDAPGLFIRSRGSHGPTWSFVVANNDGGGIFSSLEQAAFPGPFERVFGTPHGTVLGQVAAAAGFPPRRWNGRSGLPGVLRRNELPGTGIRMVEVRTSRAAGTALRRRLRAACAAAGPPR